MSEQNLLSEAVATDGAATGRPDGLPDKFWDAQGGQVRMDDLIKSYCALEKRLSAGPSVPEDPEGRMKIFRALGMPETPDGYDVTLRNDLLQVDPDVNARLHAKGFTCDQVQEVYDLAAERLVPLILGVAAEFQADREVERLKDAFGGADGWREVARQLLAFGRKNLPPVVLEGLSGSYDGVMALYRMMKGDAPALMREAKPTDQTSEADLHTLMRDPKYWRDKDPATIARVSDGFKRLYGTN